MRDILSLLGFWELENQPYLPDLPMTISLETLETKFCLPEQRSLFIPSHQGCFKISNNSQLSGTLTRT